MEDITIEQQTRLQQLTGKERTSLDDLYQIESFDYELGIQVMEDSENTEDWNHRRDLVLRRYSDENRDAKFFNGWIDGTGLIVKVLGKDLVYPSNFVEQRQHHPVKKIYPKRLS